MIDQSNESNLVD